jgi:hypothetical protein
VRERGEDRLTKEQRYVCKGERERRDIGRIDKQANKEKKRDKDKEVHI